MLPNCFTSVVMSFCVYRSGNILSSVSVEVVFRSAPRKVPEAGFEALWTSWISKSQRNPGSNCFMAGQKSDLFV